MAPEIEYLIERSRIEAVRAIQSPHPAAAAVHEELCHRYTGRALQALIVAREATTLRSLGRE